MEGASSIKLMMAIVPVMLSQVQDKFRVGQGINLSRSGRRQAPIS